MVQRARGERSHGVEREGGGAAAVPGPTMHAGAVDAAMQCEQLRHDGHAARREPVQLDRVQRAHHLCPERRMVPKLISE